MTLKNKVALVTGGAVRVGRAIVLGLAKQGVNIGLHYHKTREKAQQVVEEIQSYGVKATLLQGDFTKIADIESVVNQCYEHFKKIDILINNAAIYYRTPFG
ncbi:MAG: SDR family NAD(P)-dependent oxidoreductase, partial [Calditrichaeota bacterium]